MTRFWMALTWAGLLASTAAAQAADSIAISYQASTGGAPMMKAGLSATIDGANYSATFNAKTTGVTNMLSKYKLGMNITGNVQDAKLVPAHFTKSVDKKKKDKSVDLTFASGGHTLVTQDGPQTETAPVIAASGKGKAVDPLTAILRFAMTQGAEGAKPCSGKQRMYDGRDVVDLSLSLVKKSAAGYQCKLTYQSVAGRDVEDNDTQPYSYGVWLAPVAVPSSKTPLFLPVRLTGTYSKLPVTVEATGISVNGAGVAINIPD